MTRIQLVSKQHPKKLFLTSLLTAGLLPACGGSNTSPTEEIAVAPVAEGIAIAPVVEVESRREAPSGSQVLLTATASDTDGTVEAFEWAQLSGPSVVFANPAAPQTEAILPDVMTPQIVTLQVTVTDNAGNESRVTFTLSVLLPDNLAPNASAGEDIRVAENQPFTLSASASSDPEDSMLTYEWIDNASSDVVSTAQTYSATLTTAGQYDFTVKVSDPQGAFDEDRVQVTVVPEIANAFSATLNATVASSREHISERDCENFRFAETTYLGDVIEHAILGDMNAKRLQDQADIATDKNAANKVLEQQKSELVALQKELDDLGAQLPLLEDELDQLSAAHRTCISEKSVAECTAERTERNDVREEISDLRRATRDKKSSIDDIERKAKRAQRDLTDAIEREARNQRYFDSLNNAKADLDNSTSEFISFHAKRAQTLELGLNGELKESENERLLHSRLVQANNHALQAAGLLHYSKTQPTFAGGVGEYSWRDIWSDDLSFSSNASSILRESLSGAETAEVGIDYASYCGAGFTDGNSNFALKDLYMEMLTTASYAYKNQYQVTYDINQTFDQLTLASDDYGLLTHSRLLDLLDGPLAGFDLGVIDEIDAAEVEELKEVLQVSYLNQVLTTYAIPVISNTLESDCALDSQNLCQYRGWWLRHDNSPLNPNGKIDTDDGLGTLFLDNGQVLITQRKLIPITIQ